MERVWAAEITVDAALARTLIEEQFPALSPVAADPLGAGWDNTVFRINGRYVFRFPRRQIAVALLETERRCLPVLAPYFAPVEIPVPLYEGKPCDSYPWPFVGYAYLAGRRALRTDADIEWRVDLAVALARFLKTLHAIPIDCLPPGALPPDTFDRLNSRKRLHATETRLASIEAAGVNAPRNAILALLGAAPDAPDTQPSVAAHGDLHAGQVLVDANGRLKAVIDWGDLHLGHPAVDLAVCHQLLPPRCHGVFLSTYGPVDATTWQLARARAAWHAVAMLASSLDVGDDLLVAEARTALNFIADGDSSDG